MELKIPQLTLAKIAQLARHETVNTRSEHYSPRVEGSIYFALIQLWQNCQNDIFKESLECVLLFVFMVFHVDSVQFTY